MSARGSGALRGVGAIRHEYGLHQRRDPSASGSVNRPRIAGYSPSLRLDSAVRPGILFRVASQMLAL